MPPYFISVRWGPQMSEERRLESRRRTEVGRWSGALLLCSHAMIESSRAACASPHGTPAFPSLTVAGINASCNWVIFALDRMRNESKDRNFLMSANVVLGGSVWTSLRCAPLDTHANAATLCLG